MWDCIALAGLPDVPVISKFDQWDAGLGNYIACTSKVKEHAALERASTLNFLYGASSQLKRLVLNLISIENFDRVIFILIM